MVRSLVFILAGIANFPILSAQEPTGNASPKSQVDFARDMQPVLEERCLSCHGPEKQESSFRVDLRESLHSGGDSGSAAIVPGEVKKSVLLDRIEDPDPETRMPPEGKPLTAAQIANLKAWIESGAKMPERFEEIKRTTSDHWSFQPLADLKIPQVQNGWIANPD